ncbi:cysteine-rich protein 2-binding protein [Biomphalaria glabrata]|uniref:Cysteine-rich protein 2-binding protein-like n=1 Tax=Biomphalaria glabrata TaxID=6526 RepID=A0A9W3AI78_BIOGL|nr:cysteine-rich protein 2-binding protein-like [Biomphalaria glabrata]XP_055886976.1 cysteine-rich protein 2-binding protein-like [Biomphalaria glabrata]XP_055886977.1 cysteine-rich protein 2-binding protein-like [Biomphalaria glabrata]KAI8754298.1 cysteine-rich protein 2-binding protein-like [Biomphalaria glabrata]
MEESDKTLSSSCAYCEENVADWNEILCYKCDICEKYVHYGCIRSSQPSPLLGDTFFSFKCENCGDEKKEEFERINISWLNVVLLTLYNLQKTGQGKCGFFHWKNHICVFIETHWTTFFGFSRKRTTLWMGTVAGTLSSGCPHHFISGAKVLEQGYWQLAVFKPPLPRSEKKKTCKKKSHITETPVELFPESRRCKRAAENSLVAAIQLKEKRTTLTAPNKKNSNVSKDDQSSLSSPSHQKKEKVGKRKKVSQMSTSFVSNSVSTTDLNSSLEGLGGLCTSDDSNSMPSSELSITTSSSFSSLQHSPRNFRNTQDLVDVAVDEYDDLDIDIGSTTMSDGIFDLRPQSPDISDIFYMESDSASFSSNAPSCSIKHSGTPLQERDEEVIKQEPQSDTESEDPSEEDGEDSQIDGSGENVSKTGSASNVEQEKSTNKGRPRKRRRLDDAQPIEPPRLKRVSVFEEGELLQKLNLLASKQTLKPELAQLRRKLICNQTNREYGLPVFDLEIQMEKLAKMESLPKAPESDAKSFFPKLSIKSDQFKETRDLDRFMMHSSDKRNEHRTYTSFQQRLVGLADHELKPVVSPYTTRVLLPFIWRNYNASRKPLKMRLLQEIQAYPHKHDPSWVAPPCPPIDYCYVRAEHIPSVNALCREHFWPGIDMSECLQYPDFSCVVLYRKIVIAFAFMVPDRGYNEAYISFIFTHPEWRGAGIAKFMLYHLIQTCMGKDVLLHVSVTNPAMLLYQEFGFKCQELILNFYYKYFPLNCKDSTHAFLMRLSR